jgi:hypothetical protein
MFSNREITTISYFTNGRPSYDKERRNAAFLFDMAYGRAVRRHIWAKLTGRKNELRSLSHYAIGKQMHRSAAVLSVPLDQIVGSESRTKDFDAEFNPLRQHNRERWAGLLAALWSGIPLPPVELIQVGNEFFVRDGHHRISIAKATGQLEIEARIVN